MPVGGTELLFDQKTFSGPVPFRSSTSSCPWLVFNDGPLLLKWINLLSGVATTISPSPGRDHVNVHERNPIPTHTPCTHLC